ncbi:sterol desaturase family protein [Eleftheria terrae]|uniref:sterol desaturase family protein n=1 Tax=Eleftheria terrae TaxID=1597781 RepID=UPI00263BB738|nr:sterol desaturase family protein [Eleftheria terrae]WKB55735.1 sterol desaturase family protein [Eleftheria terrae]
MACCGTTVLAEAWRLDRGTVSFAFLLATIGYLALLERFIPYDRSWHPTAREWGHYGIYFLLTVVGGAMAQAVLLAVFSGEGPEHGRLPLPLELLLALLAGSLASYWVHRLGHTVPWLWRLHGVHHVPQKVNVANNGVNHLADVLIAQLVVQATLSLLGLSQTARFAVGLFVIAQGYFTHANIDVRLGRLNHLLASPEQHRLHHSTDLDEAGHYGSDLSIWDRLFGSFTWQPQRRPRGIGLAEPDSFPATGAIGATLLHPWRKRRPTRH